MRLGKSEVGGERTDDNDEGLEHEKIPHLSRRNHEERELNAPEYLKGRGRSEDKCQTRRLCLVSHFSGIACGEKSLDLRSKRPFQKSCTTGERGKGRSQNNFHRRAISTNKLT